MKTFVEMMLGCGLLAGCGDVPGGDSVSSSGTGGGAAVYAAKCAACHGAAAEGNQALRSPSLAGLPDWYLQRQLDHYRQGLRGYAEGDVMGQQMRTMAELLPAKDDPALIAFLSEVAPVPTTPTLEGDVERGRKLFGQHCSRCHRYNGSGEKLFGSPPLVALPDWYLEEQIEKFRSGTRGTKEGDIHGQKMGTIAKQHLKEDEIRDVLVYVAELAQNPPTGDVEVDEDALPEVPDF